MHQESQPSSQGVTRSAKDPINRYARYMQTKMWLSGETFIYGDLIILPTGDAIKSVFIYMSTSEGYILGMEDTRKCGPCVKTYDLVGWCKR
jgi:hypothetical protein